MYNKWVSAASKGKVSGAVFVDLSAAFDLVSPGLLIEKLRVYGVKEDLLEWIKSYLDERYQSVWIDHVFSEYLPNTVGVPQGSNLGPLFFLIFFNDLPSFIEKEVDCYADDSTLSASSYNVIEVGDYLSSECVSLCSWMNSNGFKLNAEKTKVMTLGTAERLSRLENIMKVRMDDTFLEESETGNERLLGVSIKADLKWTDHIAELTKKLKVKLSALDKLRHIMRRSDRKIIVQGVFESVLCYCLPLFGGCNSVNLDSLQSLQNRAARIALNLPSTSNRVSMFQELNWLTIRQLVVYHTLLSVYRIRVSGQPDDLARCLRRENYRGKILVQNCRLELYRRSFIPRGSTLWNRLPSNIRMVPNQEMFKREIKGWIKNNIKMFEN